MTEDGGATRRNAPWTELETLRPFFHPSTHAPQRLADQLRLVLELEDLLWRRERQVTFVGAFKAGKSALLNALIGAPLLPHRANRATGVVTTIRYGPALTVTVVQETEEGYRERQIEPQGLAAAVLLDLSGDDAVPPTQVEEVRVEAPLPLLPADVILADTPGLLEGEALTERSYRALERSDLAVMVLSADKVLSARERDAARHIDRLLYGNIVYALNRLDLVEEDDRAEVLDWVEAALKDSGNDIVGQPGIFATIAASRAVVEHEGVDELRDWLSWLLAGPEGDRLVILSRLGVLEAQLNRLQAYIQAELAEVRRTTEQARTEATEALARERAEIRGRIAQDRVRLQACRERLPDAGDLFVSACVEETLTDVDSSHIPATLRLRYEPALERYADHVNGAIREAVIDAPVTVPALEFSQWVLRAEVSAVTDPASDVGAMFGDLMDRVVAGGSTARDTGASLGSWFSKNVLGIDAERETRRRIENVARGVVPSLQEEVERHIEKIDGLLQQADDYYAGWTRVSSRVAAAEENERAHERVLKWCEDFLGAATALVAALSASREGA